MIQFFEFIQFNLWVQNISKSLPITSRRNEVVKKNNHHFQISGGRQINISNDQSTINAKYTEIKGIQNEQKLIEELRIFIKEVQKEPNLNQLQEHDLTLKAETILDDIEDDNLSKKRLSKFRETISNYMPEISV